MVSRLLAALTVAASRKARTSAGELSTNSLGSATMSTTKRTFPGFSWSNTAGPASTASSTGSVTSGGAPTGRSTAISWALLLQNGSAGSVGR